MVSAHGDGNSTLDMARCYYDYYGCSRWSVYLIASGMCGQLIGRQAAAPRAPHIPKSASWWGAL